MPPQSPKALPLKALSPTALSATALPDRRRFLGVAAGLALASAWPARAKASVPRDLAFDVFRGNAPIGSHSIGFRAMGADLVVEVAIELEVTFLFVTAYRYSHRNREIWRDGLLQRIATVTDDNGRRFSVTGVRSGQGLRVETDEEAAFFPGDLLTSTFWQPALVRQDSLLNTQDGRVMAVRFEPGGWEEVAGDGGSVRARRFTCSGDLELDLWRDDADRLAGLRFLAARDGSVIDYRRRPVGAG